MMSEHHDPVDNPRGSPVKFIEEEVTRASNGSEWLFVLNILRLLVLPTRVSRFLDPSRFHHYRKGAEGRTKSIMLTTGMHTSESEFSSL